MPEDSFSYFQKKDQKKIDHLLLAFETLSHINQAVFIAKKKDDQIDIVFENELASDEFVSLAFKEVISLHNQIPKHAFGEIDITQSDVTQSYDYRLFLIPSVGTDSLITFRCIIENITSFKLKIQSQENKKKFSETILKISHFCSSSLPKRDVFQKTVNLLGEIVHAEEIEYWEAKEKNLFETNNSKEANQKWHCLASLNAEDLNRTQWLSDFGLNSETTNPICIKKTQENTFEIILLIQKSTNLTALLRISNLKEIWHPDHIEWNSLLYILEAHQERIQNIKYLSLYQEMFFQSHEANLVISYNPNNILRSRIESVNFSLLILTGYEREELIGKNARVLTKLQKQSDLLLRIQDCIHAGENLFTEFSGYKKNGEPFDAKLTLSIIRGKNGDSNFIFINLVDISQHKQMEDTIAKRMLFEVGVSSASQSLNDPNPNQNTLGLAMHDFLFFSGMDCVYLMENKGTLEYPAYEFLFHERRETSQIKCEELFQKKIWNDSTLRRWHTILVRNEVLNLNFENCEERERPYFIDNQISILLLPIFISQRYFGVLVWEKQEINLLDEDEFLLFKSVSSWIGNYIERTQIFQELKLHKEHLEDLVIERTKDLVDAKEKAESANKLKSEFLSLMSHELRTPLNSIIGFTKLIQFPPTDEMGKKYLSFIHKSGLSLLKMINELLELSKIEAGKVQVHLELLLPYEILLNCKENLMPQAIEQNVSIFIECIHDESLKILSDKNLLFQILQNLLSNAIKFSKRDSSVFIQTFLSDQILFVSIRDHGEGVKKEDLPFLFESFRRFTENATIRGTGLGLTISKKFAHLLNGDIIVESELGKGSVFTLKIPAISAPD